MAEDVLFERRIVTQRGSEVWAIEVRVKDGEFKQWTRYPLRYTTLKEAEAALMRMNGEDAEQWDVIGSTR